MKETLRIVWTIAAKDIADAVRNRITLAILLSAALMGLGSLLLPLLLGLKDTPSAILYDAGESAWVQELSARDEFRLRLADSPAEVERGIGESPTLILGLLVSADLQSPAPSDAPIEMDGVVIHWADQARVAEWAALFEKALGEASGRPVHIDAAQHTVYPSYEANGQPFTIAMNLTVVILVIGLTLIPHLLFEEKETHTLEALLVSPARLGQIVAGKALTGMFYCLLAAAVILLLNGKWILHWEGILLAVVLGAALATAIGLLVGAATENPATMNVWIGAVFVILLAPVLLNRIGGSQVPGIVQAASPWVPSVPMSNLMLLSMAGDAPAALTWSNAGVLVLETLILYGLVVWRVRRSAQ